MEVCKLKSVCKNYIWGGNRLFDYGKQSSDPIIAESWELSVHKDGQSIIDSGEHKGKALSEVIKTEDLGKNAAKFPFFPILNKLIDAKDNLSIQVHPCDEYALKNENSFGKTEMWYVVEADDGAMLHIGLNKDVSKEEFETRIKNNTLLEIMNHIPVKAGDCYYIPSGTLHAIGSGCFICEIQENSNITYRVYDYGRIGKGGKPRELHVANALEVTNLNKMIPVNVGKNDPLVDCEYFKVRKFSNVKKIEADDTSFVAFTILNGEGFVNDIPFRKGDSFFIPSGKYATFTGDFELIESRI